MLDGPLLGRVTPLLFEYQFQSIQSSTNQSLTELQNRCYRALRRLQATDQTQRFNRRLHWAGQLQPPLLPNASQVSSSAVRTHRQRTRTNAHCDSATSLLVVVGASKDRIVANGTGIPQHIVVL